MGKSAETTFRTPSRDSMHERLMDGVTTILATSGWDAVNAFAISKAAGTSTRPAYDRFPERSMVATAYWESRARVTVDQHLAPLWRQVAGFAPNAVTDFIDGCNFVLTPSEESDAVTEILLAAAFEDELRSLIVAHFETLLVSATGRNAPTDIDRARSIFSWSLVLGLLITNRRVKNTVGTSAAFLAEVAEKLQHPAQSMLLPPVRATFMELQRIETGDAMRDAFLNATLRGVASAGYRATTFETICRDASVSEGAIFSRYKDKMAIILEIVERRQREAIQAAVDFHTELGEQYERHVVEAIGIREVFRPEYRLGCNLAAEIERLARHENRLLARLTTAVQLIIEDATAEMSDSERQAVEREINLGLALGVGTQTMALFSEGAWTLPFDSVTAALV